MGHSESSMFVLVPLSQDCAVKPTDTTMEATWHAVDHVIDAFSAGSKQLENPAYLRTGLNSPRAQTCARFLTNLV